MMTLNTGLCRLSFMVKLNTTKRGRHEWDVVVDVSCLGGGMKYTKETLSCRGQGHNAQVSLNIMRALLWKQLLNVC